MTSQQVAFLNTVSAKVMSTMGIVAIAIVALVVLGLTLQKLVARFYNRDDRFLRRHGISPVEFDEPSFAKEP